MGKLILLFGVLTGVFFVLYQCGILVYQSKTAVSFVGSPKGNGATFRSCSGFLRRVVRFRADGTYTYVLNAQLSKGADVRGTSGFEKAKPHAAGSGQSQSWRQCRKIEEIPSDLPLRIRHRQLYSVPGGMKGDRKRPVWIFSSVRVEVS